MNLDFKENSKALSEIYLIALGLFFPIFLNWYSIGYESDSMKYIRYGEQLFNEGFLFFLYNDLIHYPVLFPILHGFINSLFEDYLISGLIINTISYYGIIKGLHSIFKLFSVDTLKPIVLVTIFGFSFPAITITSMVLTEALFQCMITWVIFFTLRYEKNVEQHNLFLAAIVLSLLPLVRYAGGFISIGFGLYAMYLWYKGRLSFKTLFLLGIVVCLPMFLYVLKNSIFVLGNTSQQIREIAFYPLGLSRARWLMGTVLGWVGVGWVTSILFYVLYGYFYWDKRKSWGNSPIIFVISSYLFLLILSVAFFDRHIPFNDRILIPIYFLTFVAIGRLVLEEDSKVLASIMVLGILLNPIKSFGTLMDIHQNSILWSHRSIQETEIYTRPELQEAKYVLSDYFGLLTSKIGRQATDSFFISSYEGKKPQNYYQDSTAIVLFKKMNYREYYLGPDDLIENYSYNIAFEDDTAVLLTNF